MIGLLVWSLAGLATLCAYNFIPFLLLGSAWRVLDARGAPGRWATFIWSRIVRDSAGELLPFAPEGKPLTPSPTLPVNPFFAATAAV